MRKKILFGFIATISVLAGFFITNFINQKAQVSAAGTDDFITTWNSGEDHKVELPIYRTDKLTGYDYTVDWGDGSTVESFGDNGRPTHTYPEADTEYDITISGTFPGWTFFHEDNVLYSYSESADMAKRLVKLKQWGTGVWQRADSMFQSCSNLEADYTDSPNFSQVPSLKNMFSGASKFNGVINFNSSSATSTEYMFYGATNFNQPLILDTTNVTNMYGMFSYASNFNQELNLSTSNAISMTHMFTGAANFNNGATSPEDIRPLQFDTHNVTSMHSMFYGAKTFNQPLNFNTGNVINMARMFYKAFAFNQPLNFSTNKVTSMEEMFYGAAKFNQTLNFDTSNVTNMHSMFNNATSFNNGATSPEDIRPLNFNTLKVREMNGMFSSAAKFNQPLNFDTRNVTNMAAMFAGARKFNQTLNFNTSNVKDMGAMFWLATAFNNGVVSPGEDPERPLNWDTSKVEDMIWMFWDAKNFNQTLNFNTIKVADMNQMFLGATAFNNGVVSPGEDPERPLNWNTSNVTDMASMFSSASTFNQPLNFNIVKVSTMESMFYHASSFNQSISFDTQSVRNMNSMFAGATSFNNLDQPLTLNTINVWGMKEMFSGATSFNQPLNFNTLNVTRMDKMFSYAKIFNQPLNFDTSKVYTMESMFSGASAFNQDLSGFTFGTVTNLKDFAKNANLSTENYDKLLIAWRDQIGSNGRTYETNVAPSKYCTGKNARIDLRNAGWVITDGGDACLSTDIYIYTVLYFEYQGYIIPENSAENTTLGAIMAGNAAGHQFTLSLGCDMPGPQDDFFSIEGTTLKLIKSPDYETTPELTFCVRATNNTNQETLDQNIGFWIGDINETPTISGEPITEGMVGELYNFIPTVEDEDGDELILSASGLPDWLSFNFHPEDNTYRLSGTPTSTGDFGPIILTVSDGEFSVSLDEFNIHINRGNIPPLFISTPILTAEEGIEYVYEAFATDADGDTLTFSAPTLPDWLSFDPDTHILSGTPTADHVGQDFDVEIMVDDGKATDTQTFTIHVRSNTPPEFTSTPILTAEKGTEYSYTVSATDADGDTLTFSAPTLPDWLSFDPVTRTLSGTPTEDHTDQDFDVEIAVSDGKTTVTQSFSIHVNNREEQPEIPAPNTDTPTDKPQDNQTASPRTGQTTKNNPTSQQNRLIFAILCGSLVIIYGLNLTRRHFAKK